MTVDPADHFPLIPNVPGFDPFADETTVTVPAGEWANAVWALQVAALAVGAVRPNHGFELVDVAARMTAVTCREAASGRTVNLWVPKAGLSWAGMTCEAAAAEVTETSAGYGEFTPERVALTLLDTAVQLKPYLT